MLEYDNSAFYYFTLSLISIYLVPVTLVSLQQVCTIVRVNFSSVPGACYLLPGSLAVHKSSTRMPGVMRRRTWLHSSYRVRIPGRLLL